MQGRISLFFRPRLSAT